MKKSDFEELSAPRQIMFLVEQAGVKWDAEGVEELPVVTVFEYGPLGFCVSSDVGHMTIEQAREAVRLLRLIPKIRDIADRKNDGGGIVSPFARLCQIHDLLAGAKP